MRRIFVWLPLLVLAAGCPDDALETGGGPGPVYGDHGWQTPDGADSGSVAPDPGQAACEPGTKWCEKDQLLSCPMGGGDPTAVTCQHGCVSVSADEAECKSGCVANTAWCQDESTLVECDADGVEHKSTCDTGKGCVDGACAEPAKLCEPDVRFCEVGGKTLLQCSADGLSAAPYQACKYGCDDEAGKCKEPVCEPGQTRCAPDDPTYVEVCLQNQTGWKKAPTPCKYDKCVEGECWVPNCQAGLEQCGAAGVEQCDAAGEKFELVKPCKVACLDGPDGKPACAKCEVGLTQCNGTIVEECVDALAGFATLKQCSELQACSGAKCIDKLVLTAGPLEGTYLLIVKGFADCLMKGAEGSCRGIDSQALTNAITKSQIRTWFCDNKGDAAFAAKFGSEDVFLAADDVIGCGTFNLEDLTIEGDQIVPGKDGYQCIGFTKEDGWFGNGKQVIVKPCAQF